MKTVLAVHSQIIQTASKRFVGQLIINNQVVAQTEPMMSRQVAMILLNRKIADYSFFNGIKLPPYQPFVIV